MACLSERNDLNPDDPNLIASKIMIFMEICGRGYHLLTNSMQPVNFSKWMQMNEFALF